MDILNELLFLSFGGLFIDTWIYLKIFPVTWFRNPLPPVLMLALL
jgi:hypothetical protein